MDKKLARQQWSRFKATDKEMQHLLPEKEIRILLGYDGPIYKILKPSYNTCCQRLLLFKFQGCRHTDG